MCVCPRNDPLRFPVGYRRRRLNHGLVVALGFSFSVTEEMFLCYFLVSGCMLRFVRYLFVISTGATDYLERFVSECGSLTNLLTN